MMLLCNTPMQLRMLMQAEAVQRAHSEVRDAASTAARKRAGALRTFIETKLDLVLELELEAQLLARASPLPITALPAAAPRRARHDAPRRGRYVRWGIGEHACELGAGAAALVPLIATDCH